MWDKLNKVSVQVIVAVIGIVASFALLFLLVFKEVPAGNRDLFNIMIGVVVGSVVTSVVGWLFTTNKGNKSTTPVLIFLACLTMFASCKAPKVIIKEVVKDSIHTVTNTVIETKDSAVYVPGDSVTIHDSIPCPDVTYSKEVTKGKITAKVTIGNGKLQVDCKYDSLFFIIQNLRREIITLETYKEHSKASVEQVPVKVPVYRIPKWLWWVLLISLALNAFAYRVQLKAATLTVAKGAIKFLTK
jgi:hypothetical protein